MSRIKVSPTRWVDEGPSRAQSYSVGFVVRPALTVGSMVPFTAALRQDVGPKRREQMAEQKRRARNFVDRSDASNLDNGGVQATHHRGSS